MKRVIYLIKLWRKELIPFTLGSVGISIRNFVIVYLNAYISAKFFAHINEQSQDGFVKMGASLIIVVFIYACIDSWFIFLQNQSTHNMMTALRRAMFKRIISCNLDQIGIYEDRAEFFTRVNSDIDLSMTFVRYQILTPMIALGSGIGASITLYLMGNMAWILLATYGVGLMLLWIQRYMANRVSEYRISLQNVKKMQSSMYISCLENQKRIRMCDMQHASAQKIKSLNQLAMSINQKLVFWETMNGIVTYIPSVLQYTGGIGIGFLLYSYGMVDLHEIVLLAPMLALIVRMFVTIGDAVISLKQSLVGFHRIFEILTLDQEAMNLKGNTEWKNHSERSFCIHNLKYSYHGSGRTIHYQNMKIENGKITAICGPSGCGKSTLLRILMGLYEGQGKVILSGYRLSIYSKLFLRENIGYAPQEPFLLKDTIRDVLLCGNKKQVSDEHIIEILEELEAYDWVRAAGGLDALIIDGGKNLSGGQKAILALSRVMLLDVAIMVFDETLASLDIRHKEIVMKALNKRVKENTCIIIVTHERVIQRLCDTCIVLCE